VGDSPDQAAQYHFGGFSVKVFKYRPVLGWSRRKEVLIVLLITRIFSFYVVFEWVAQMSRIWEVRVQIFALYLRKVKATGKFQEIVFLQVMTEML
jgi:hypothetical protein